MISAVSSFKSQLDLYLRLKYQEKICKSGLVRAAQKPGKCFLMNSVTNTEVEVMGPGFSLVGWWLKACLH